MIPKVYKVTRWEGTKSIEGTWEKTKFLSNCLLKIIGMAIFFYLKVNKQDLGQDFPELSWAQYGFYNDHLSFTMIDQ